MLTLRTHRAPASVPVFGREFDRLLEGMFAPAYFRAGAAPRVEAFPALNLFEDGHVYHVESELPGFSEKDINISVSGDVLTISGQREADTSKDAGTYHRRERWSGSFERSIRLPGDVNADAIAATLSNGILSITLPKPEVVRPRKIDVKTA